MFEKPNNYTKVIAYFRVQMGKRTNPKETGTDKFGLEVGNEGGESIVDRAS